MMAISDVHSLSKNRIKIYGSMQSWTRVAVSELGDSCVSGDGDGIPLFKSDLCSLLVVFRSLQPTSPLLEA